MGRGQGFAISFGAFGWIFKISTIIIKEDGDYEEKSTYQRHMQLRNLPLVV